MTCNCLSTDARECLQQRYAPNMDVWLFEPCQCQCHVEYKVTIWEKDEDDTYIDEGGDPEYRDPPDLGDDDPNPFIEDDDDWW